MKFFCKTLLAIIFLAFITACGSKSELASQQAADETNESNQPATKPAVCIWKEVSVKEAPEEKGKYKTTIYLGEKFTFTGDTATDATSSKNNKYVKIKLMDNTEGWVRQDFVAIDATPAAFVDAATIYKRPDMMTSTGKNFQMMDFVAIKTVTGEWSEVIGKRIGDTWFSSGWVKSDKLTRQEVDVAVSVFYSKAMEITDETKRAEEIQKIIQNPDLSNSVFYSVLAGTDGEEVIEESQEEGEPEETGEGETDEQ